MFIVIQAGVFNITNEAKVQKPKICCRMTNAVTFTGL